jgi:ubiquinol-cytochrome c reductase subunit 7
MFKSTPLTAFTHGAINPLRSHYYLVLAPGYYKDYQAINTSHKVERHLRLQNALKANKVDIRNLLALPVTDNAHPYRIEYAWEKIYKASPNKNGMTSYAKFYQAKVRSLHELFYWNRWGIGTDDLIGPGKAWWGRAARTRAPIEKCVHSDRKMLRAKAHRFHYYYEPKHRWMHPVDNVAWYTPYLFMVIDEWEEKWGFFSGMETEY